ncbi:MAG TPA: DUF6065 family protein, partial [Candidatus Methylacidiphilales bacterium]
MKLIAYKTYDYKCQTLVPAARTRDWMDKTPGAFAYHCLPLVMANSLGWFLINNVPCEMEWDGTEPSSGLKVWATEELTDNEKHFLPSSHFGSGIVTFHAEYMFWTERKISIIAKGPANMPKHGIHALEGVIETDWLPYPFTMNWKMTEKNLRVRFERGEPIAQIIPWPLDLVDSMEPEILSLQTNPELYAKYEDYRKKRGAFNEKFLKDGKKRQKYYVRGEDSLGNKYTEDHRT